MFAEFPLSGDKNEDIAEIKPLWSCFQVLFHFAYCKEMHTHMKVILKVQNKSCSI